MKELSRLAQAVQASTTMAIDSMFKQMKADGIDVIGFGAGEPDFNTPDEIKAAGIAAIEESSGSSPRFFAIIVAAKDTP